MGKPTVSVLTATWNRAHLIGAAIESVRDQTFPDWELIVVDDGSTDTTAGVIRGWQAKDKRIAYFRMPTRESIAAVSNLGLAHAQGKYVAILDDDDWWIDKRKLEKQVAFMDAHPDCVACGGGIMMVDERGKELGRALKKESDAEIRNVALFANPMANSTTLFRADAASAVGRYDDTTIRQFADWDFWLKLGLRGKFYNFPEYFAAYRIHPGSSSFQKQRENADAAIIIVKRYRRKYPGFWKGILYAYGYRIYTFAPLWFRRGTYAFLSSVKKRLFARALIGDGLEK